jgi:cell division transport system permease protein
MKFKPGTILTIISLTLTLFLLGVYLLIIMHISNLENIINEKTPFVIELRDDLPDTDLDNLLKDIKSRDYIRKSTVEFITKEQGLRMLENQMGNSIFENRADNPLKDVIRFFLDADFIREGKAPAFKSELLALSTVENAFFEFQEMGAMKDNLRKFNYIFLIAGVVFISISLLLIFYNLKLVLRGDRKMLRTMELVGASPGFIKMPYIKKSLQIGLLSGVINVIILLGLLLYLDYSIQVFTYFLDISVTVFVFCIVLLVGILLPVMLSNLMVNKYIRLGKKDF